MTFRSSRSVVLPSFIPALLAVVILGSCGSPDVTPPRSTNVGVTPRNPFTTTCVVCHGARGEGNPQLRTPSIAGLPDWYVTRQLEKFRAHQRGTAAQDVGGQQMHAIALTLRPEDIVSAATTVAALPLRPTLNTLGGDQARGRALYLDGCVDCHRYNGSGELAFRSAPLTGLQDWYLVAQLEKFRAGTRGTAPADEDGAKMHLVANGLSDQQLRDVVAYVAELAAKQPDIRR